MSNQDNKNRRLERINGELVWVSNEVFPSKKKCRLDTDSQDLTTLMGGAKY